MVEKILGLLIDAVSQASQCTRILELGNAERIKLGLLPLKQNNQLSQLAALKAQDILDKNYFSHESPTYGSPFDMMRKFEVPYSYAGENLAINQSAEGAHKAWMDSPDHKRNILNPSYREMGIQLRPKGKDSYIYVVLFIG